MSAGRYEYLDATLKSIRERLNTDNINPYYIIHEDMTYEFNEHTLNKIKEKYKIDKLITTTHNLGAGGSIFNAWNNIDINYDYIWHHENDFIFNKDIKLKNIIKLLESSPVYLNQMALLRQPVSSSEFSAGSIYNLKCYKFEEQTWIMDEDNVSCIIHKNFWTANPSLYRKELTTEQYIPASNEVIISSVLKTKYPDRYFGYYGKLTDPPIVTHIGSYSIGNKI